MLNLVKRVHTDHLTRVQPRLWGVKVGYEHIVDRDTLSLQFPAILLQNEWLLYLIQTVLRCRYAVDSCHDVDLKRSSCACAILWRQLCASQAMSIVKCNRWRAARLLHSHKIEIRTIRRKTHTPNTSLHTITHYSYAMIYCHVKWKHSSWVEPTLRRSMWKRYWFGQNTSEPLPFYLHTSRLTPSFHKILWHTLLHLCLSLSHSTFLYLIKPGRYG